MSLNGLDELKLKEAHDIAAAEPGGWFLLKYISRDEVDLLGKGNGGIVEIRNAVSSYEEPSPLFGFLRYRRRNVLIKYVPEGCSRLVQARVTVHFNAVTERFSPHDTVFPITTAKELRDTTLSSACSLHTASGSISSSTSSLRRRRLMEIAEDEEEDNRKRQSTVLEERPGTAKTNTTIPTPASIPVDPSTISLPTTTSHKSIAASLETSPPPLREPTIERPSPSTPGNDEPQPRKSSQSTRPDTHGYSSYGSVGRPKVKLGPRPSLDVTGGRPHTSGAASHYRPVSTLPVGLKILSKASRPRPQSQFNAEPPNMMISPPPMPDTLSQSYQITPTRPHTSGGRPPPCPTFPMKPLISPTSSTTLKTTLITPEKARLMKALELRKKHMKAPVSTDTLSPSPNEKLDEGSVEMKPASETSIQVQDTLAMLDDMAKASDTAASFDTNSAMRTDESDATRSDSYPVSPVGASEQAESTRASSISESTDGTLQESHTPKAAVEGEQIGMDGPRVGDANEAHNGLAEDGLKNGIQAPSTGILASPKLDVPYSPIETVAVSNTPMDTARSTPPVVQTENHEEMDDLEPEPLLEPEEPLAVSLVEVTPAPVDLTQKSTSGLAQGSAQEQVLVPESTIEEVFVPPTEPVKVDKHVTFDKSGDHIIEDTTIASDGSVTTDDLAEFEELPTIEAIPSAVDTVAAQKSFLCEIPKEGAANSTFEEPLTANASVAVIEDAPKSAEMDVVKEGEDSMKFPEGASSNKEQSIPESVVAQASAPVEIQLPSIRKEERMAEQAKPQYSPERIPIPGVSSKSENDDSAGQDLNTISDDLKPAATIPSISTEPPSVSENTALLSLPQRSPVGSTFSIDTRRSATDDEQEENGKPLVKRGKRKGFVEPIKTDFEFTDRSDPNSDAHLSSDDDFMDELQSAVVQEAKPVSVSKSPINAMFPPAKKPESWRNRFTRAASNPAKKGEANADLLTPPPKMEPVARSVSASAAYLKRINQENSKPLTKKVNVGSGISQRIKAFEKFSNGDPAATPPPSTGPLPGTTSAFFSVRKAAPVRVASKSPSIADRANSLNRNQPSPSPSRESSPEARKARERSGSIKNRVSTFEPGVIPMIQPSRSKPESISVTARIVRDPDQPFQPNSEIGKDPSEYVPLDLKQSPLVIDHQRAINNATPPKETIQERRLSKERRLSNSSDATNGTTKNRRSSITIVKDLINERRASFADRRRSINLEASGSSSNVRASSRPPSVKSPSRPPSVRSPSRPSATHPSPTHTRSQSISSRLSSSSNRDMPSASPTDYLSSSEDKAEKKSNRASRMLRRMSSSLSSGRKALAHAVSPTVREESEPVLGNQPPYLASPHSPAPSTPSVNIGDVNVQFPDSLLWKRRSMLLDSQGFLILSPALTASGNGKSKAAGGATRRFHLSEFRQPVIPDMEIEELPNSVLLDFFEGGGLQIACEDRAGQGRVLEVLQDVHRSFSGNGY